MIEWENPVVRYIIAGMEKQAHMHRKRQNRARSRALFLSALYFVSGSVWIFLSDAAVIAMYPDFENQAFLQLAKGLFFVLATAGILYLVIHRLALSQEELRERLSEHQSEHDMLVREMHHRIKNNLQFVISMLGIQRNASRSPDVFDALGNSQARIRALAIANSALYRDALSLRTRRGRSITPVLDELVRTYEPFIALSGGKLRVGLDLGETPLSDDLLIPVSLGTGEILSLVMQILEKEGNGNSLFTLNICQSGNAVVVELEHDGLNRCCEISSDTLDLLSGLAAQTRGSISVPEDGSDRFVVVFGLSKNA